MSDSKNDISKFIIIASVVILVAFLCAVGLFIFIHTSLPRFACILYFIVITLLCSIVGYLMYQSNYLPKYELNNLLNLRENWKSIFNQSVANIAIIESTTSKICYANPAFLQLHGYTETELLNQSLSAIANSDKDLYQRLIKEKKIATYECLHQKKDGLYFSVALEISYCYNNQYILVQVHDIASRKTNEEKFYRYQKKYSNYIDNSPTAIFVFDKKLNIVETNKAAIKITGYTSNELLTLTVMDLIAERAKFLQLEFFDTLIKNGKINADFLLKKKNGVEFYMTITASRLSENRFICFCNDITNLKRLEDALKNILSGISSKIGTSFFDSLALHLVKTLNADFASIYELDDLQSGLIRDISFCSQESIMTNKVYPIKDSPLKEVIEKGSAIYKTNVSQIFSADKFITDLSIDGFIGVSLYNVDKEPIGIIAAFYKTEIANEDFLKSILEIFAHISAAEIERKQAVDDLVTLNHSLEERVKIRTAKLEEANNELKDFAYIVSHDLKAPLRSINQLAIWLSTDYGDKLDKEGKELIHLLESRVMRLNNLIDGILQYSRAGRSDNQIMQVDINLLVHSIIESLSPPQHVEIKIAHTLPTIEVDKIRIQQVFQNLISNAIKFMNKQSGLITVDVVEMHNEWQFSVADNGPGIDEKYFEKIFQIFQTLSPKDEKENTGIGLSIVKKIIEMHGGKIWVTSTIGAGATFTFTLPKKEI